MHVPELPDACKELVGRMYIDMRWISWPSKLRLGIQSVIWKTGIFKICDFNDNIWKTVGKGEFYVILSLHAELWKLWHSASLQIRNLDDLIGWNMSNIYIPLPDNLLMTLSQSTYQWTFLPMYKRATKPSLYASSVACKVCWSLLCLIAKQRLS